MVRGGSLMVTLLGAVSASHPNELGLSHVGPPGGGQPWALAEGPCSCPGDSPDRTWHLPLGIQRRGLPALPLLSTLRRQLLLFLLRVILF